MGNVHLHHECLVHVRGWTREQIKGSLGTLRSNASVYRLSKEEFTRYFGGRNREMLTIFNNLDTDRDGLIDIFETFVVLIIWSGTAWQDKQDLLFSLFDMMGKGFLKLDELLLMGRVLVRTMSKFVDIDSELHKISTLQKLTDTAIPPGETKLTHERFRSWVASNAKLDQLKGFIEDIASRGQADSNSSRMRMHIVAVERHAAKLHERIERLQDMLPEFRDACIEYVSAWGRRKRWDFMMQNMRQLVLKLHHVSDSMFSTLAELEQILHEDELSGGMAAVVDPHKRLKQEQMLSSLELMRNESQADFREATELLQWLIELTEPSDSNPSANFDHSTEALGAITEDEREGLIDISPPRVVEHRNMMRDVLEEMSKDIQQGGIFFRKLVDETTALEVSEGVAGGANQEGATMASRDLALAQSGPSTTSKAPVAASQQAASAGGAPVEPTLVAIADFEPPASHHTQMLRLHVGDQVTVIGMDGRGWWYGSKPNGKEGWFPPSYVQMESAHFSSASKQ